MVSNEVEGGGGGCDRLRILQDLVAGWSESYRICLCFEKITGCSVEKTVAGSEVKANVKDCCSSPGSS